MTLSFEHEYYGDFVKRLIDRLSQFLKQRRLKGAEPDACFYVQSAKIIGNKIRLDLRVASPPDVVLEVDIHPESFPFSHLQGIGRAGALALWRKEADDLSFAGRAL